MCKRIPLSRGKFTLVDDADHESLSKHKWTYDKGYAIRRTTVIQADGSRKRIRIPMHDELFSAPAGMEVDHRNRHKLDNRRRNFRPATRAQNVANTPPRKGQYKGVSWSKKDRRWRADIAIDGRKHFLGNFRAPEEAARAYDVAAYDAWGEFAYLNFPYQLQAVVA